MPPVLLRCLKVLQIACAFVWPFYFLAVANLVVRGRVFQQRGPVLAREYTHLPISELVQKIRLQFLRSKRRGLKSPWKPHFGKTAPLFVTLLRFFRENEAPGVGFYAIATNKCFPPPAEVNGNF